MWSLRLAFFYQGYFYRKKCSISPILDSVGLVARSASIIEVALGRMIDPSYSLPRIILPQKSYKLFFPIRAKGAKTKDSGRWLSFPGEPGEAAEVGSRFKEFM